MTNEEMELIMSLSLFKEFKKEELMEYLDSRNAGILRYKKGEVVFNEGEICSNVFVILDGTVEIEKIDTSGRYLKVIESGKNEMMGPNVLFSHNSIYPLSTRALNDVILLYIKKELLLKLCQANLYFLEELLKITSSKAFMLTKRLDEVTIQTLKQNIARFLYGEYINTGKHEIILPFTKKLWAEKLGVQRPSLQRELKFLEDMGLIEVKREVITLKDPEGLKSIAYN